MDKALIRSRFAKASGSYLGQATVQRGIALRMADLIGQYVPAESHRRVLEIGCGTGLFTRAYLHRWHPERMLLNDLCPEMEPFLRDVLRPEVSFSASDAERLEFPGGQDLIVSCSALQWFDAPERFLCGCNGLLEEGGYLAFSTFGRRNAQEIRALTSDALPYRSLEELAGALSDTYRVVYASEEEVRLSFPSPLEVLRHLKATGVTGIRSCTWTKAQLASFCRSYTERYAASDGTVPLTYHPMYVICRKY
ncbi:malonyl-ACP O-methyltransferase BioC [Phocaeicola salanitronis]|uniref:malonyl-ACP O-methyltransferase BioC n=1 Tax=Phocaeicola salanitronis TaxID=376805 RepID=UPI0025A3BD04|nr:malonyl-ACP O-methyltransferase BioC [Phocaeicola salanitronis]MDM8306560.1 malonyl-ACP O-methyltransferase BioC [Phocaeicola salanitronis]